MTTTNESPTGRIVYCCSECGDQVDEYCAEHPKAMIESVFVSHVQDVREDAIAEGRDVDAADLQAELCDVSPEVAAQQIAALKADRRG